MDIPAFVVDASGLLDLAHEGCETRQATFVA